MSCKFDVLKLKQLSQKIDIQEGISRTGQFLNPIKVITLCKAAQKNRTGEQEVEVELSCFTLSEWKNFTSHSAGNNVTERKSPAPTSATQFLLRAASLTASLLAASWLLIPFTSPLPQTESPQMEEAKCWKQQENIELS